jgi:cation diffusion facilitator family transporter
MHQHERYKTAKKVTVIGALFNTFLGFIKCTGGVFFHSHALFADGLHSFSDLLTDSMVVFASKYGSQHADETHPYGHQRIETAATFFLAMLLIVTGLGIAWDSLYDLIYHHQQHATTPGALLIALISILINESLFYYTRHMGLHIKSDLLIANAWHHRSDAASSLIVLSGIAGSLIGFTSLDAIAAILVGLLIIHMGLTYCWNSIKELIDTAVSSKTISQIKTVIKAIDGVKKIHQLRTRSMGRDIFIDVHVIVSPFISVSEGHYIAQIVHHELMNQVTDVKDVTVHIDPEDDEAATPSLYLPNRKTLESQLLNRLKAEYPTLQF